MDRKARLFLVEPARREVDMSSAETFGPIVTVFEPPKRGVTGSGALRHQFRPSVFDSEAYAKTFLETLEGLSYDPEVDYFLFTGGMFAVTLAFTAIVAKHGRVKLLVFNSSMNKYVEKTFDIMNVTGETLCRDTGTSSLTPARITAAR